MAEAAGNERPEIGNSPISTHDFALPGAGVEPTASIQSQQDAPTKGPEAPAAGLDQSARQDSLQRESSKWGGLSGSRSKQFFRRGWRSDGRGAEASSSLQPQSQSQPQSDIDDVEPAVEVAPSTKTSVHGQEVEGGGYKLDIVLLPGEKHVHYLDIVAVHDYDETAESWVYKDRDQLLRQKIEHIKAKRTRLQAELSAGRSSIGSLEDGGDQNLNPNPNSSKTGSARDFNSLSPDAAMAPPFPQGLLTRQDTDKGKEAEGVDSSRHTEASSSRASSPAGHMSGLNWLQDTSMLPRMLPGARIIIFSYPKLNIDSKDGSQADYLETAASELRRLLLDARADYKKVPVVFIGAGFGGVVVQRAIAPGVPRSSPEVPAVTTPNLLLPPAAETEAQQQQQQQQQQQPALFPLDHLADVIFLDTPFPADENGELKAFFPINVNVRACAIVEAMEAMKARWDGVDVASVWSDFWAQVCQHRGQEARVLWFYSAGRAHPQPKKLCLVSEHGEPKTITLHPLHSNRLRRLTNFHGPDDPNYKSILARLCDDLMLRAVCEETLKELQQDAMRANSAVGAKDELGLSPLHRAAAALNPAGVNMLLGNHADPQVRDPDGQTPLHCAIRMFCDDSAIAAEDIIAARVTRNRLKQIIEQLLDFTRKSELYNSRDKWGVAPHDLLYGDKKRGDAHVPAAKMNISDYNTIRELLSSHQPVVSRRLEETKQQPWKGWSPPSEGSAALRACERAKAIVAEFYADTDDDSGGVLADYDVPSVLELVYQKDRGPEKILSRLAERHLTSRGDVRCRWIHMPANNEQWLQDLFIRLRLTDGSMLGQRQSGHSVFNRYMVVQAKRYKQKKFRPPVPTIEVQAPAAVPPLDPIPEDYETLGAKKKKTEEADFLEVLKAERGGWPTVPLSKELGGGSEAIVLFMPVLAYEKHRERKVMSRAIRRASHLSTLGLLPPGGLKNANVDTSLIEAYLNTERPLHCRRTLDQYSYYMLETTESRDLDQVVYKWARKQQSRGTKDRPIAETAGADVNGAGQATAANVVNTEVIYKVIKRPDGSVHEGEEGGGFGMTAAAAENVSTVGVPNSTSEEKGGRNEARHRPVIMVDQLWLWILPDGTVVTSLPNTANAGETYNLKTRLEVALFDNRTASSPVQSVDDLVQTILKICVDFSLREGPCGVKFQDCFQYSISDIAEEEANMYAAYKQTVKFLEALGPAALSNEKKIDTFSQVTNETNRLVEIMDIQDELKIIDSVLATQKNVLQTLAQQILAQKRTGTPQGGDKLSTASKADPNATKESGIAAPLTALRDSACVQEAMGIVEDQIRSVAEMVNSAKRVQEDLKNLLDFKQQQSGAWETRFSRKLAEQGQKQNNIMLVFTLVTIVFLPMSFISSFFALGIDVFPKDSESGETSWPITEVSAYLFGISLAVSLPMIVAAFYVNPISRMVKGKRKRDLRYLKEASAADRPDGHDSDVDSDESDSSSSPFQGAGSVRKTRIGRRKHRKKSEQQSMFSSSGDDDEDYAPLFGRRRRRLTMVHTKIPFVRRLWEYKTYRLPELQDLDAAGFEDLEWDYPLSRWRKMIARPVEDALAFLGLSAASKWYVNYVKDYRLARESDELIRELFLERMGLEEEMKDLEREREKADAGGENEGLGKERMSLEKRGRKLTGGLSIRTRQGEVDDERDTQAQSGFGSARGMFRRALPRRGPRPTMDEESRVD